MKEEMKNKTEFPLVENYFESSNINVEDIGNGKVRVKMAVKAEEIKKIIEGELVQKAPAFGRKSKKTFWNRVKEVLFLFKVRKLIGNDFSTLEDLIVK